MIKGKVWVYRNLKHGRKAPPLYSVMQNGRVIAHVRRILLGGAKFVVREAGRQRVLKEGRKNVHAFVVGQVVDARGAFGIDKDDTRGFPAKITYNPHEGPTFMWGIHPVKGARAVLLNETGVSATYLE